MRIFLLIFLMLFTVSPSTDLETIISGSVIDSEGAVIGDAYVFVHWDPSGSTVGLKSNIGIGSDLVTRTNEQGRFSVKLPPGFYDLFVTATAFTPSCKKVRTKAGETLTVKFALDASPLVTKELGTKYSSPN